VFFTRFTSDVDFKPVVQSADRASFKNLSHAAATIRKEAIASVHFTKEIIGYANFRTASGKFKRKKIYRPSPVGTPVYSHKNAGFFRQGIRFDATKESAVIGPAQSKFGESMRAHEFGEQYKGHQFAPRPVMNPALEQNVERFAKSFAGSVHN
jgi:hypothetical protein